MRHGNYLNVLVGQYVSRKVLGDAAVTNSILPESPDNDVRWPKQRLPGRALLDALCRAVFVGIASPRGLAAGDGEEAYSKVICTLVCCVR